MPKHDYRGVTTETRAAVEGFVKEVAYEWDVTPAFVYAILSGKEPDPFKNFLELFRATCRKNPDGARGFIAKLNAMLREEEPRRAESIGIGDATRTFADVLAVSAELEEGMCPPEKFETAKQAHAETVERLTVYAPKNHLSNLG